MPNHIQNHIHFNCDEKRLKEILTAVGYDDNGKNEIYGMGTVDFNKIIPMPESLNIEAGSRTDRGLKAYKAFLEVYTLGGTINSDLSNIPPESEQAFLRVRADIKKEDFELGKIAFDNIQKYGVPTWYEYCIGRWNTKWNSYSPGAYDGGKDLYFQTAWSAPHPILQKLSEMYPDVTIIHEWADEDIGQNCGRMKYTGGEITEEYIPESNREALEFAAGVWDCDLSEYDLALNAAGMEYINTESTQYELIELLDKPMLFTNERITNKDIPAGLYCYDLRHSDDNDRFCSLEPHAMVNHGGTVITNQPVDFGEAGYIPLTDETDPNFIGSALTFGEYMRSEFEQDGGMKLE